MLQLGRKYRVLEGIESFSHRQGVLFGERLENSLKSLGVTQALHLAHTPSGHELMLGNGFISFLVKPDENCLQLIEE